MNSLNEFGNFLEKTLKMFKDEIYKHAPFDKTYKCRIVQVIDTAHKYKIDLRGKQYTISSPIDCKVDDFVWVCIPRGNEREMFVIGKTK